MEKVERTLAAVGTSKPNATGRKKASCCQKNKRPVLAAQEKGKDPSLIGRAHTLEEPNPARGKVSTAGLVVPGALGCFFLILAFVTRRGIPMVDE